MQNINAFDHAETILKVLAKGAFLTTAAGGRHNTMTIGWGALGNIWGKPVFTVMVRHSRYTHELIEAHNEFTVSFPLTAAFSKALGLCGSKSGRDMDKFAAAEITPAEGQTVKVPVIKGAGLHLECCIVEKREMAPENFDKALADRWYAIRIGTPTTPARSQPLIWTNKNFSFINAKRLHNKNYAVVCFSIIFLKKLLFLCLCPRYFSCTA